jgi:5-methylcytosine-specific restriction enzyme A
MGKLTTLKSRLQTLKPVVAAHKSGDDRIRGSALQRIRDRILTRDRGVCQCARCQKTGAVMPASIVDHTIPLWAGGAESDHNRQAINSACHDLKSAHEAACRAAGAFTPWTGD